MKPRLLLLASGTATTGGSGAANLVYAMRDRLLDADIVGFVSNHEHGGVAVHAEKLQVPFKYFPGPWTPENYRHLVDFFEADYTALSGWVKPVRGLDPCTTFNIHPGPLPWFGGKGMYGHHVHEAILKAYGRGELTHSEVTMHFVTDDGKYDTGPVFFRCKVPLYPRDTVDTIAGRVNTAEHLWQPMLTHNVLAGEIGWDGKDPASLFGSITV